MSRSNPARWTAPLALAVTLAAAPSARADGPFEGQWREGPMRVQVQVQSWGGDCGPRPRSTTSPGGGQFRISQSGDQLTFHLRRQRTTRSCWSENRAVRRVSSTHQAGTWRIVCRTPSADSRAETGTYTIRAIGEDRLQFRDESRYDWQLNESSCQATILTTQSFTRVGERSQGTAAPTEQPAQEPERPRCTPSDPARVVLRPPSAQIQPGGEQCFTTRVVDADGCALRARPSLAVAPGDPGSIRGRCYVAADGAGRATVVASFRSLRAEAQVSVHTMDLSDLIARRTESGSLGSGTPADASSRTAARVSAAPARGGRSFGLLWPLLALAGALLLVGVGLVLVKRRGRAARPAAAKQRSKIRGLPEVSLSDPGEAPSVDGEDPSAGADPEPDPEPPRRTAEPSPDAEPSAGLAGAAGATEAAPDEDWICPTCRRGYRAQVGRCPHDDTALMPYREFVRGASSAKTASNVCPRCGRRYPANVKFCGTDGAVLESE